MVRLGLAKAKTTQIFRSAKYGGSYKLLESEEVETLRNRIVGLLRSGDPYGAYDALIVFGGREVADELRKKGEVRHCRVEHIIADRSPKKKKRRMERMDYSSD
jgi:hypothetical protein